jgi:hypothetical protein
MMLRRHAIATLCAAAVARAQDRLGISVAPVVDVVSRPVYAAKIVGVVMVTNLLGVLLYRARAAMR